MAPDFLTAVLVYISFLSIGYLGREKNLNSQGVSEMSSKESLREELNLFFTELKHLTGCFDDDLEALESLLLNSEANQTSLNQGE